MLQIFDYDHPIVSQSLILMNITLSNKEVNYASV